MITQQELDKKVFTKTEQEFDTEVETVLNLEPEYALSGYDVELPENLRRPDGYRAKPTELTLDELRADDELLGKKHDSFESLIQAE